MQFHMPSVGKWIAILASLLVGVAALYLRARISMPEKEDAAFKSAKKRRNLLMIAGVLALWLSSGLLLGSFGSGARVFTVAISPTRMNILGLSVSSTVFVAWIVIAVLAVAAALIRIFAVPRFQETPRGLADAFILGEEFIGDDAVCLILGDNVFYGQDLTATLNDDMKRENGATIYCYPVKDARSNGEVEFD